MNKYIPEIYKKNIQEINYKKLKEKGIKVIAFDFDNTIIERHNYEINKENKNLFNELKKDYKIIVLSNSIDGKKLKKICNEYKIEYILNARKPSKYGFNKIKEKYNVSNNEICLIGDQLCTDVYGANKANVLSILVDPINNNENIFTKINRFREKIIYKKLEKNKKFKRGKYYE